MVGGTNNGKPVLEYQRAVPVITYIINENMRSSLYYEKNLTPERNDAAGKTILNVDKLVLNIRMMI